VSIAPIRLYGDQVLRQKATPVAPPLDSVRELVATMGETMYAANGIGLAANQIGDTRRVLVADVAQLVPGKERRRTKDPSRRELLAFLNAEITGVSDDDEPYLEGCLSMPGLEADVFRPSRVRVRYRTLEWEEREDWFEGLLARVLQHEIDHLDGVLFTDKVEAAMRAKLVVELGRIRRGEVKASYPTVAAGA
jgi:peptide deformylase